ncbi:MULTISPECIES: IS607 family element RNA-guided endonuclease TnpB [Mycobacterium]|jgi:putative transposase|nr:MULTISPECIES: IS607 family element RNA-guided endonuclease TnpB [Mycobacterium]ARV85469.1 transposase [Mycobacterium intracellulare subsp. chimaera]ASL12369.1 transposase [Mycobacterium intracellulare subsp. chimaera]ASX03698.1 transposase [Mycobacterium intracellulare subsp. chimaera]AXO25954.1 transposase [Mycobacterium avium subsp. hominissuis]KKC05373.1 transposase [Mycobacterium nebraskense]
MIVGMRTCGQAAKVAGLTGGVQLPGKPKPDGSQTLSRYVDVGADFESHRAVVESVSVLFKLYDGDAAGYAVNGSLGAEVASGWLVTAAKFEVEWPAEPERAALVRSHFGARRKAFNWGLGRVKADLDAKSADPEHESLGWDLGALRKAWNLAKHEVAPWWATNSKECYSAGLADLAQALSNWSASKNGRRQGRRVGFPRFATARRDPGRVRFTTGTMRVEDDRHSITVPVISALRSKENTRRVQRHLASGRARILNMTLSQRWGRLFVSVGYALRTPSAGRTPTQPTVRAGVDLGVRTLATVATIDPATGVETVVEYKNPAPLKATLAARRRAGRELSRRIPGSHGHRAAKAKLTRLDRRCVHLRREAAHQLTTQLAGTYGQVVIEDLDVAAMKRSMGRRAFRRSVSDAAMGLVAPMLAYKTTRHGSTLIVADRWFPSSQLHHRCTHPNGTPCRLVGKGRIDKHLICPQTGEMVDRDRNAALNLRDWPDYASCGPVGTTAPSVPGPTESVGTGHGADTGSTGAGGASVRPRPRGAGRGEAKTPTPQGDAA